MKKILVLLLIVAMVTVGVGICEGIDVKSMSDEELMALWSEVQNEIVARDGELLAMRDALNQEIGSRQLESNVIYPGKYIAGVDIKAASFVIVPLVEKVTVEVYAEDELKERADYQYILYSVDVGEQYVFSLFEGEILNLRGANPCMLTEQSKPSWAP